MPEIEIARIDVSPNQRLVKADKVSSLANSIKLLRQVDAIIVRPSAERYVLVSGAHRLEAVKLIGHTTILALVLRNSGCEESDSLLNDIAFVEEEFRTRRLTAIERSLLLAQREKAVQSIAKMMESGDLPEDVCSNVEAILQASTVNIAEYRKAIRKHGQSPELQKILGKIFDREVANCRVFYEELQRPDRRWQDE